jgi:hypothetical protein
MRQLLVQIVGLTEFLQRINGKKTWAILGGIFWILG